MARGTAQCSKTQKSASREKTQNSWSRTKSHMDRLPSYAQIWGMDQKNNDNSHYYLNSERRPNSRVAWSIKETALTRDIEAVSWNGRMINIKVFPQEGHTHLNSTTESQREHSTTSGISTDPGYFSWSTALQFWSLKLLIWQPQACREYKIEYHSLVMEAMGTWFIHREIVKRCLHCSTAKEGLGAA